jgi:UDP-N-acetylglucosamine 3-dehydrogenase
MLRTGVIGTGAMGQNHARIYSELADVELVGVADIDFDICTNIGRHYNCIPFRDYRELLKQRLDAVSIVVPTSLHAEVAAAAACAGVNMLVEKPLAEAIPAAKEIIRACKSNNIKLMVGHVERFNPVVTAVRKEIEQEDVSLLEITRIGPFPPRVKDVGIVIDLATHDVDLIRYLTGSEFKKAFGLISRNLTEHEDLAILAFEMANGTLARVTTNWLTPFKVRELTIATKKKYIKASLTDQRVTEYSRYAKNESYLVRDIKVPFGEPLKLEITAFLDCIRNDSPPPISGDDGLRVLEVLGCCDIKLWPNHSSQQTIEMEKAGIGI